ncbi:MAG TPA: ABC transporter permease [Acidobacteriota bacterium]|jgi:putative ABC transport system permease protein|nr:ABC transporter permease [Acidobacteriota bacterium]
MKTRLGLFGEAARLALLSIYAHKMRTFLTLLGIIIGVAAVMLVGASITGLQTYVEDTVSRTLGSDSFLLAKFAVLGEVSEEEWEEMVRRNKDIYLQDVDFLREHCPDCREVAGELDTRSDVTFRGLEMYDTEIHGVTANYIFLGTQNLEEGRFFTSEEVRRSRPLCVIGWDLYEKFFPGLDPIGKVIKVGNTPLEVVGVLEKLGSAFGQSLDNTLYLPITKYQKMYGSRSSIVIRGTAVSKDRFEAALDQVRVAMRIRHGLRPSEKDTFGLISTEEINSFVGDFVQAIAVVVVPITAIALVVGGIVVMNIMLVSVTERTFEIGLRKALGARRRDILNQFLIESFVLAVAGGVFGLLLAVIAAQIVEVVTGVTMTISWGYIVLSVTVSGGIGVISGIYPAYSAARLDPIEALRSDR